MGSTLLTTLILGFTLGMEHALDADHVVAVSTIVSQNKHPLKAALVGTFWGIGHTTTLFLVGMAVIGFKLAIPEQLALSMEFLVGVVLFVLGAQIVWEYRAKKVHTHTHDHNGEIPVHPHLHSHADIAGHKHHALSHQRKSLMIGMIHGLAGSAALMLIVLSTIRSPLEAIAYILIFGGGSILGMMLVSTLIGLPFALSHRFVSLHRVIRFAAGAISIVLGMIVMYNIGFIQGLIKF
ncbi:MAG: urease accessory protein UreH [Chloroflexi bacterium]|nr:urease accessory protein UreH [Chloroflexota bacterium]